MANPYELPNLPTNASYENVMEILKSVSGVPTLQSQMAPLAGEQAKYLQPQIEAIRELTGQNVAASQTEAMKRGLTGSSIEAQNMQMARTQGGQTEAKMRGEFALSLTDLLARAIQGDTEAAQQLRYQLAQAMGQKVAADQEKEMFLQQLEAMNQQASSNRKSALWGSAIQGGAQLAGGLGGAAILKYSDGRLKGEVDVLETVDGVNIISWRWNAKAGELGLPEGEKEVGVLANQVKTVLPDVVEEHNGYLHVHYGKLPQSVKNAIEKYRVNCNG